MSDTIPRVVLYDYICPYCGAMTQERCRCWVQRYIASVMEHGWYAAAIELAPREPGQSRQIRFREES